MLKLRNGFTLIELLVTIVIVCIIALVAIPTIRSTMQDYRVKTAAEELYSVLVFARSEAVKRNTLVYVSFTPGSNWCYGVHPETTCNCGTAGSCTLGSFATSSEGQTTLSLTSGTSISFEGSHAAANASNAVTFTVDGTSRSVRVNIGRLGSLRMCSIDISGYSTC